jgi:hypothetical protein
VAALARLSGSDRRYGLQDWLDGYAAVPVGLENSDAQRQRVSFVSFLCETRS